MKKATLERLAVQDTIYFQQLEKDLETEKRDADTKKVNQQAQWVNELA